MTTGGSNGAAFTKCRPVIQYDLKGNKVAYYPSIKSASDAVGISSSSIAKCAKKHHLYGSSSQWRYADDTEIVTDISATARRTNVKICQYSLNGELIQKFLSLDEASAAMGCSKSALCLACKGKINTVKGYFWCYEDNIQKLDKDVKAHPIISQFDKNKKLIQNFKTASEASRVTGINAGNIYSCCEGRRKTAGGFIWEYQNLKGEKNK